MVLKPSHPRTGSKLLAFWVGTTRVPAGGFASLSPDITIALLAAKKNNQLPVSHVCFNRLDIPSYPSKEAMRTKLLTAIENTGNAVLLE